MEDPNSIQIRYEQLNLHKFNPSDIKQNSIIGIIGRRNVGKSILIKDLIRKRFKQIETTLVVNPTEHNTQFYSDFVSKQSIYTDFDENVIKNLIERQHDIYGRTLESNPNNVSDKKRNKSLLILDDALHLIPKKNTILKSIFFNSRHLDISLIFTMQYPIGLTPNLRSNIDYLFIFNEPTLSNRKRLYEQYCCSTDIISFDMVNKILDSCIRNNYCLVIDIATGKMFWYKADNEQEVIEVDYEVIESKNEVIENPEIETKIENNRTYLGYIKSFFS